MKMHFGPKNSIVDIDAALPMFGIKEFASPTRSTIPMLALLKHDPDLFREIVGKLGLTGSFDLFLEYTVGPFGGRGKPSHTDVMVTQSGCSLAIEAKWTEPMYETVKDWLSKGHGEGANRKAVLQGWLGVLQNALNCGNLDFNDFDDVVYQMIHRASSAAYAGKQSRLAYFLFKPSPDPRSATGYDILKELSKLKSCLGHPQNFPIFVVEIELGLTPVYKPIQAMRKGQPNTAMAIQSALQASQPLFQFGPYTIHRV
jgi:hypothetical protein